MRTRGRWGAAALLVALLLAPLVVTNVYHMHILNMIGIFAILALGLNLVLGFCGQFSLGQAGFFGIGAYTSALLVTRAGLSFWLALPAAAVVAGACGVLIGPVMRLRGGALGIVTLALGEIVRILLLNLTWLTRGPMGIVGIPAPRLGPLEIATAHGFYYIILAAVVCHYVVTHRIIHSRVGRAMRAVRDNELAAEATGIATHRYKIKTFGVASFFTGAAGSLYAHMNQFISPYDFTLDTSVEILTMVVLGGAGSTVGPVFGAALLVLASEWLRILKEYRLIVYGLLVAVILVVAPRGLAGVVETLGRRRVDRLASEPAR